MTKLIEVVMFAIITLLLSPVLTPYLLFCRTENYLQRKNTEKFISLKSYQLLYTYQFSSVLPLWAYVHMFKIQELSNHMRKEEQQLSRKEKAQKLLEKCKAEKKLIDISESLYFFKH